MKFAARIQLFMFSGIFGLMPVYFLSLLMREEASDIKMQFTPVGAPYVLGRGPYAISLFLSMVALGGVELGLMALVGLNERQNAKYLQQMIFDLPCFLWGGFVIQQFFQFYSNTSMPWNPWSYALVALALAFAAVVARVRLIAHGILPPADGRVYF